MSGQESDQSRIEQILRMLCPASADGARPESAAPSGENAGALHCLLDEMPGGFLIYYADGDEEIIYANRALLSIFRCESMEEFRVHTGNSFRGLVHPDDLEEVEKSIRAQIAASQCDVNYVEYRVRCKDGDIRWIEDYGHYAHIEGIGDIFYVFLGDATEKRQRMLLEKALLINDRLEKEQKLRNLIQEYDKERGLINQEYLRQLEVIEGLSVNYDTICFADLDQDQITPYRMGRRASEMFYDELPDNRLFSRFVERYVELWVHPEDRELMARGTAPDYIRERLSNARTYYVNYRVVSQGEPQYLQLRVVNVSHGEGVSQVVLGYRRIEEEIRQEMEQQALLAEALTKANQAINSKNVFLSNMSHDMRTPLNAIFGFTTLAKMNLNHPEEVGDYLNRVETAGHQLLNMIDEVLRASALSGESGVGLDEAECDLRSVVEDVCDFLRPQAQEKDITFTLDCDGLHHNVVFTNQEKLRQLMMYQSRRTRVHLGVRGGGAAQRLCGLPLRGGGHRHRHQPGIPGESVRALQPGKELHPQRRPWHRPGAGHREEPGGHDRRNPGREERGKRGQRLYRHPGLPGAAFGGRPSASGIRRKDGSAHSAGGG